MPISVSEIGSTGFNDFGKLVENENRVNFYRSGPEKKLQWVEIFCFGVEISVSKREREGSTTFADKEKLSLLEKWPLAQDCGPQGLVMARRLVGVQSPVGKMEKSSLVASSFLSRET